MCRNLDPFIKGVVKHDLIKGLNKPLPPLLAISQKRLTALNIRESTFGLCKITRLKFELWFLKKEQPISKSEVKQMAYHFNNRIKIVKEVSTGPYPDDKEEKVISSPWADIKTMKGSEYLLNNVTASEEPTRFIIRYRQGIDTTQRIKWNGKNYNIESVANDNGMNQTLTIFATGYE